MRREIHEGDLREVLARLEPASLDACVCDPPYALTASRNGSPRANDPAKPQGRHGLQPTGFMGQAWDGELPGVEHWRAVLRVLKPGAHLLAFGGTRTVHRLAVAIEDAGFEIRDMFAWVYGSGFPKSLDVSKAIDEYLGAERPAIGVRTDGCGNRPGTLHKENGFAAARDAVYPATAPAMAWTGWGTALKPAHEPIVLARKPLASTVAACVLEHGTGALNVDGCRIPFASTEDQAAAAAAAQRLLHAEPGSPYKGCGQTGFTDPAGSLGPYLERMDAGRWPANVAVTDGALGPELSRYFDLDAWGEHHGILACPKAARAEREAGCEALPRRPFYDDAPVPERTERPDTRSANHHPTVKPVRLMRWLVRLVTPPGGVVLDPFAGSGSTGLAAVEEGCGYVLVEREPAYVAIARARLAHAERQGRFF